MQSILLKARVLAVEMFGINFLDFWENSVEDSLFSRLCHFRWSVTPMSLKLTQNYEMATRNIIWRVKKAHGFLKHILRIFRGMFCVFRNTEFRRRFLVFHIVSNDLNFISKILHVPCFPESVSFSMISHFMNDHSSR